MNKNTNKEKLYKLLMDLLSDNVSSALCDEHDIDPFLYPTKSKTGGILVEVNDEKFEIYVKYD